MGSVQIWNIVIQNVSPFSSSRNWKWNVISRLQDMISEFWLVIHASDWKPRRCNDKNIFLLSISAVVTSHWMRAEQRRGEWGCYFRRHITTHLETLKHYCHWLSHNKWGGNVSGHFSVSHSRSTKQKLTCDYIVQPNLALTEQKTLTPKVSTSINTFLAIFASLALDIITTNLQEAFHHTNIYKTLPMV